MVSTKNVQITYSAQIYKPLLQKPFQIMFLIMNRRQADAITEQLLYQTDKRRHRRRSIKKSVCKNLAIFTRKNLG